MRAWAVVENGAPLKEIELPTPEPKGTEVLLEVTHCGVCHSDLHIWEGYYDIGGGQKMSLKDRGVTLPLAMGHEIVGRVAKLGPDAKGVKVGDLRIVYPWLGCGKCEKCLAEEDNMCAVAARSLGVYQNGGYGTPCHRAASAPSGRSRARSIRRWPRPMRAPASRSIPRSRRRCRCRPTQPIVLVGAGGLGLNAIAVLKALKHQNIIVGRYQRGKARGGAEGRRAQGGGRQRRRDVDQAHHRGGRRAGAGGDRPGQRHRHRALRVRRAAQGRQADPGRAVRRRTDAAAADHGDPRADRPGQLCRQSRRNCANW